MHGDDRVVLIRYKIVLPNMHGDDRVALIRYKIVLPNMHVDDRVVLVRYNIVLPNMHVDDVMVYYSTNRLLGLRLNVGRLPTANHSKKKSSFSKNWWSPLDTYNVKHVPLPGIFYFFISTI